MIFRVENTFETNMFKCVFKWNLSISSVFAFIIINVKTLFNFEKEWCTFDKEKRYFKKIPSYDSCLEHAKGLLKHHQFTTSFDQWNFINNGTLKWKKNENPIYYAPLVIFQRYKIIILNSCDTPCGSFYCVYIM
jgi:hypothetical protein